MLIDMFTKLDLIYINIYQNTGHGLAHGTSREVRDSWQP